MKKMKKGLNVVVLIAAICLVIVSLWNIGDILLEYKRSRDEYDSLRDKVFVADEPEESTEESAPPETESEEDRIKRMLEQYAREVELARAKARKNAASVCKKVADLQSQREDVVGWIQFLTLDISYPVMQGDTNDEYLYQTWSGMANKSGSIFMDSLNTRDFQDSHTLIYGHNMKDGSMFGKLKNYKVEYGYEKCPYFVIYTPDDAYEYHIFAYYDVAENDDLYTIYYDPSEEFSQLVQSMKKHSWKNTGVSVSKDDKVITLSTCSTEGRRFVVNAVRSDEYPVK